MTDAERLKTIAHGAEPKLEKVLATDSLTQKIPESLQLRYMQCGLATAALQGLLSDEFGIKSERLIKELHDTPKHDDFSPLMHVVLRAGDQMINPTYGQFFNFVGLTHKTAADNHAEHLYPPRKIMVYSEANAHRFADKVARRAYDIDRSGSIPRPLIEHAPDGQLRGKSLEEMQHAYRSIWTPDGYRQFPVRQQDEEFQKAAARATESLKRLVSRSS